ncbi:carboxypeptidase-like regulatory domain-containing protein [Nocardioides sp. URHA0020]|uniref:carboxypeptidase-like regulatory domain-containing protein n=1 Tax=Nocardioides sp. URHA0020 TaxID=1380392 RepID=UPI00048D6EDB|nr:carboxypeptidase-like regulatory domain-containing protein [Nocardioides sp. URHA0020]
MYVELSQRRIVAVPQRPEPLEITISNTSDVIGGYTLRFLGADPSWIEVEESDISLFPDETRTITALITVPEGMTAGDRRITVQVRELTPPEATSIEEVVLVVPEARSVQMRVDPMSLQAGKIGRFGLLVDNTGNTTIHSRLTGTDAEGKVRFDFQPPVLDLHPGEHAVVELKAKGKRPFVGGPFVRILDIGLEDPSPVDAPVFEAPPETVEQKLTVKRLKKNPAAPAPGSEEPVLANASFVQRAVLGRGLLSLLGLLFALSVFAVVITLALSRIVGQSAADRNLALEIAQARNAAATSGSSGMSGTVLLLTSGQPVPGVAIDVYPADDTSTPIANTATSDKGTWAVADLPAGDYKVTFRGAGFVQLWYPQALSADNSETVTLEANSQKAGLDVSLGGVPASIRGTVLGDDVSAASLALTVPVAGGGSGAGPAGAVVQTVPIGSDGSFELVNVPSPSVYELVVTKTGYATASQRVDVSAGEERDGVEISLRKGDGVITGAVSSASGPLGGVTISATSGQTEVTTISLTNQNVGTFTLRGLPTPASYTVVASKPGFASQTMTLTLAKGQKLTGVGLTLGKSSGSLKGAVSLLPDRAPAAGVAVTVTDGEHTIVTATQSSGHIGDWKVGGLAVPGTYTVTFNRADLAAQTLSVSLDAAGQITPGSQGGTVTSAGIEVAMQPSAAVVKGTIRQPSAAGAASAQPVGEVSVQLSSGSATYSVITASVPSTKQGSYRIESVPPGTYTLSVSRNGVSPTSTIVQLTAGQVLDYSPVLAAAAAIRGTVTLGGSAVPAGWYVELYRSSSYPDDPYRTVRTASDGSFEFDDVDAPEVYVVEVRPTRGSAPAGSRTVQLSASEQRTITVKADP